MARDRHEFIAEDAWFLVGIITFALVGVLGVIGQRSLIPLVVIVGWFFIVPILLFWGEEVATALFGSLEETGEVEDPIETIKRRYAAGEIDEEEFEARLDRLLESDGRIRER